MYLLFGQCVGKSHETSQDLYALWADVRFSLDFSDLPLFQTFTYWREKKLTSSRESVCAPNIHSKGRSKIGVTEDYFCLAPFHEVKKFGKHNENFSFDILSISVPLSWKKYSL